MGGQTRFLNEFTDHLQLSQGLSHPWRLNFMSLNCANQEGKNTDSPSPAHSQAHMSDCSWLKHMQQ